VKFRTPAGSLPLPCGCIRKAVVLADFLDLGDRMALTRANEPNLLRAVFSGWRANRALREALRGRNEHFSYAILNGVEGTGGSGTSQRSLSFEYVTLSHRSTRA